MTRTLSSRAWRWLVLVGLAPLFLVSMSVAKDEDQPAVPPPLPPGPQVKVKEPTAWRVYQRDRNGRADIPVELDVRDGEGKRIDVLQSAVRATVTRAGTEGPESVRFEDGKLPAIPTGGPYAIDIRFGSGDSNHVVINNVFVGDLWVLAGQSNMQGVGDLIDVTPPNPNVALLGMDGKWGQATEPLHWMVDSPDPAHSGDPATREARSAAEHKTRAKGTGLGLPFASTLTAATGVPIGLVACAHGGTSMEQWNPSKKGEGGKSLYGSMLRQFGLAGGKVKGVLWYQGESDAMQKFEVVAAYPQVFTDFIAAVRADFNQPDLPFYLVQIGRFINSSDPKNWNSVQDAQRRIPEQVANTAVVSVIDLELDDSIHVGTQGLKRAGNRLAQIAARELFGQIGATTPTLDRVTRGASNTLIVKLKGVNMTAGPVFYGGMGGMGGGMGGMGGGMGGGGMGGGGSGGGFFAVPPSARSVGGSPQIGLHPVRHIGGFSIVDAEGKTVPMIFEAAVGQSHNTVVLKLASPPPKGASLWYGHGLDPYCNLTDALDMAVPVFGPIPLDEVK